VDETPDTCFRRMVRGESRRDRRRREFDRPLVSDVAAR
jgi:hypothetical protein